NERSEGNLAVVGRLFTCSGGNSGREGCVAGDGAACNNNDSAMGCGLMVKIDPRQGPQPVGALAFPGGDISTSEIVNLAGGVSELLRDGWYAFDTNCWAAASVVDPECDDDAAVPAIRGSN